MGHSVPRFSRRAALAVADRARAGTFAGASLPDSVTPQKRGESRIAYERRMAQVPAPFGGPRRNALDRAIQNGTSRSIVTRTFDGHPLVLALMPERDRHPLVNRNRDHVADAYVRDAMTRAGF